MQNALRNIPDPPAPARLPSGATPIAHDGAPPPEVVHLKGKYAVRTDGHAVFNNKHINKRTDLFFTDDMPESLKRAARAAETREAQNIVHTEAAMKRSSEFERQVAEEVEKRLRAAAASRQAEVASPSVTREETGFVIGNCNDAAVLVKYAFDNWGVKLDGRRSIDVLRVMAERARDDFEEKKAPQEKKPEAAKSF